MKIKRAVKEVFLLCAGVLSAGFGLRGFLLPNNFIDGGAVGISLLISEVSGFSLSYLLILVNLPFILLGIKTISRGFALKTAVSILLLSVAVAFFPYPQITSDKLLVAVFGGLFLGTGIGLAVRGGGVIDGTEVLAINLSKKTGLTIGDIIFIINIIIFSTAAYLLSVETALYSILTYLSASKSVDFVIEGIEEYLGVTIISDKSELVRRAIINVMGNGVTIFKGEKGYGKHLVNEGGTDILYTVLSRLEVSKLKNLIEEIDTDAFVTMHSIKDTKGGMIKKKFKV
ncbi:MAG: YitT family protein [Ignavibacteriae bacterium]|nr:YitT family protein [Ignavibacteriota bacterium]